MVEKSRAADPDSAPMPQELEVARTCLAYVRDTILISRGDGDLLDAAIFTAALDANMVPVDREPDLGRTYGGVDSSAPDELRRPVSMHAVAQSLGLAPETVRRRFVRLAAAGACMITPKGVVVPREAVVSPAYKRIQRARYDRTRQFYLDWQALEDWPAPPAGPPSPEPLIRAANRAQSEYMLRACGRLLALTGDVLTSLVLLQLVLETSEGMDGDRLLAWTRDPGAIGRPIRIAALAAALPFSAETGRRHVRALEGLGYVRRTGHGLTAAAPPGCGPRLAALLRDNRADARRLFTRLASLGVLADWAQT
jgi:DNA-binding Lrp family transcriptional regulator